MMMKIQKYYFYDDSTTFLHQGIINISKKRSKKSLKWLHVYTCSVAHDLKRGLRTIILDWNRFSGFSCPLLAPIQQNIFGCSITNTLRSQLNVSQYNYLISIQHNPIKPN